MKLDIVSKHRNAIYGFAILWVMIFHGGAIDYVDYSFGFEWLSWLASLINVGNVGVDIFLFLSGICLYFSFHRKPDVGSFVKKRLSRVVLPCLIVYSAYWLIRYGVYDPDLPVLLSSFTLMRFWMTGDETMWFVSLILVLYFTYPYVYYFLFNVDKKRSIRAVLLLLALYFVICSFKMSAPALYDMIEIALTRIPIFVMGCIMGKFVFEGKMLPRYCIVLVFTISTLFLIVVCAGLVHGTWLRFFYAIGGISLSYALAYTFEFLSCVFIGKSNMLGRFCEFVGAFSLELYLSHIMLNQVVRILPIYEKGSFAIYAVVMVTSLLLAWAAMKVTSLIVEKRRIHPSAQKEILLRTNVDVH